MLLTSILVSLVALNTLLRRPRLEEAPVRNRRRR